MTLQMALDLVLEGKTDAICFAPLNKEAMHLAGMTESDELSWCAKRIGFDGYDAIATMYHDQGQIAGILTIFWRAPKR